MLATWRKPSGPAKDRVSDFTVTSPSTSATMSNPQFRILHFICVRFCVAAGGASSAGSGLDFRASEELPEPPQVLLDLPLIKG